MGLSQSLLGQAGVARQGGESGCGSSALRPPATIQARVLDETGGAAAAALLF